ncbi:hypothetical protein PT974_01844 [Cladobotryum mycophilum]|uniref:Uncharacterized protein n=1 Tax=Cladobotryum mycophilum TaxID=491253 RepID=A0ABR0SWL4_9HYPO
MNINYRISATTGTISNHSITKSIKRANQVATWTQFFILRVMFGARACYRQSWFPALVNQYPQALGPAYPAVVPQIYRQFVQGSAEFHLPQNWVRSLIRYTPPTSDSSTNAVASANQTINSGEQPRRKTTKPIQRRQKGRQPTNNLATGRMDVGTEPPNNDIPPWDPAPLGAISGIFENKVDEVWEKIKETEEERQCDRQLDNDNAKRVNETIEGQRQDIIELQKTLTEQEKTISNLQAEVEIYREEIQELNRAKHGMDLAVQEPFERVNHLNMVIRHEA